MSWVTHSGLNIIQSLIVLCFFQTAFMILTEKAMSFASPVNHGLNNCSDPKKVISNFRHGG